MSDLIILGYPWRQIILSTIKSRLFKDLFVGIAPSSTNLLKASIATTTCLLPFFVTRKFIIKSIAITSKGFYPFSIGLYSFDKEYLGFIALQIGQDFIAYTTSLYKFIHTYSY